MAIIVKHTKVSAIPDDVDTSLVLPSDWNADHSFTGTIDIANGGTGQITANAAFNALAPNQTGNTGKYLTTNGTDSSWSVNPLGTVTSVAATAGTGISVTGSPITTSGTLNITNTAPDQTVAIASGTGISATGTYPNFTIANTGVTSAVAGTGITVSGATGAVTITNSAPDQTVAIANGTGISVTGTYPNFTITNTSPSSGGTVTSVTGTSPVVSSGGNTPAISMPAATTSVDGYLTSTDWTTFNNKGNGTVTSVGISAPSIFTVSNSPVTGSGTLDLTYSGTALPLANGGTGQTTANSAFNALAPSQTSNTGKYLTTNGTDTSWATVSATSDLLENNQTIATNYTVTASKNALAVGPITINTGVSVTVGTGQRWLILN